MTRLINIYLLLALACLSYAQSAIDRPTYINQYRIKGVFLREALPKRTVVNLSEPICINGYLWVYPIDLGYFTFHPYDVITQINAQNIYGRNNWRIPTQAELMMMEDNASTIGLGDDIYMATSHSNGVLRLVSIEGEILGFVKIGNTYWTQTNLGATAGNLCGSVVSYEDAIRFCPRGFRLPTKAEYEELIVSGKACYEEYGGWFGNRKAELYFPAQFSKGGTITGAVTRTMYEYNASYFIQGNEYSFEFSSWQIEYWGESHTRGPEISKESLSEGLVRYVLDK